MLRFPLCLVLLGVIILLALVGFSGTDTTVRSASIDGMTLPTVSVVALSPERDMGAQGSGVVFTARNGDEESVYILTAAHVVSCAVIFRRDTLSDSKVVETVDVDVVKSLRSGVKRHGSVTLKAGIVVFDGAEDVALLKAVDTGGAVRWRSARISTSAAVRVGQRVFHCGSLYGLDGLPESLTEGIGSAAGLVLDGIGGGKIFDQATCHIAPGSSGGGVFGAKGDYVGMVTISYGNVMALYVPLRRILSTLGQWGYAHVLGRPDMDVALPKTMPKDATPLPYDGSEMTNRAIVGAGVVSGAWKISRPVVTFYNGKMTNEMG